MKLSKKFIIITVTVLVLLTGGGVAYLYNTPTARADREITLANKYLQDGKYQEAISAFQKVIEIESINISARLGLGQVYVATKEFTKEEVVLKEVIGIDKNNIPAREQLLKVYMNVGNFDFANTILQEIVKIDPNRNVKPLNDELELAKTISISKANYDQGIHQMNSKLYIESMTSFQKVIKEDSERFTDAQTKITECKKANILQNAHDFADAKKYDEAIELLNDALKADVNNRNIKSSIEQYTQAKKLEILDNLFVKDGDIDDEKYNLERMNLAKLPDNIITLIKSQKTKIYITNDNLTSIYTQATGINMESIAALYQTRLNRILLSNKDPKSSVLHEVGHLIDYRLSDYNYFSSKKDFANIYNEEKTKLYRIGSHPCSEVEEYFAEAFSDYFIDYPFMKNKAPLTYDYIDNIVKTIK